MRNVALTFLAGLALAQAQLAMDSASEQQGAPTDNGSPSTTESYDSSSAATSVTERLNDARAQTATGDVPPPDSPSTTADSSSVVTTSATSEDLSSSTVETSTGPESTAGPSVDQSLTASDSAEASSTSGSAVSTITTSDAVSTTTSGAASVSGTGTIVVTTSAASTPKTSVIATSANIRPSSAVKSSSTDSSIKSSGVKSPESVRASSAVSPSSVSVSKSTTTTKASTKASSTVNAVSTKTTSTTTTTTTTTPKKQTTTTSKKQTTTSKKTTTTTKKTTTRKVVTTPKKKVAKKVIKTTTKHRKHKTSKKKSSKKSSIIRGKRGVLLAKRQAASTSTSASTAGCTNPSTILYGYVAANDTGANTGVGFILDSKLTAFSPANIIPPAGYSTSFTNRVGGLFSTNYVGYVQLPAYNTSLCAFYCNRDDRCNAFNIYFERTPVFVPNQLCPNPNPQAAVTCALWGDYVDASTANNIGQYKNDFMVVITASNGYNANPPPASAANYSGPAALYGAISTSSTYGYLTYTTFSTYDPQQCANLCTNYNVNSRATAIKNGASTYSTCNYFNTFNVTTQAGAFYTMYCSLFGSPDPSAGATLQTTTSGSTTYNLVYSYGYALYPPDKGVVLKPWSPAPTGSQASCSSLAAAGSTYVDYNGVNYTIACGYDVQYSNDVGNATAPDFFSCMNLCDKFTGCSGFAYLGTTCYFKNLNGATRTPQAVGWVDMAWMTSAYAGFSASTVAATVTYTTFTTAWTGTVTTRTTSQNGLTNYVIVRTPGGTAPTTTTVYADSGTATTIGTTSAVAGGTTTVTVNYPTPTYCSATSSSGSVINNKGVRYALYSNSAAGGQTAASYSGYQPTTVKSTRPIATGIGNYIGEDNANGAQVSIYGTTRDPSTLVIANTFYLYAGRGTGYYSFTIPYTDDIEFVWVGSKALSGWTRANADLMQFWSSSSATQTPVTIAFFLTFGTYTPVRVHWGNGGGIGSMQFTVTAPDGQVIISSSGNGGLLTPNAVTSPCNSTLGAAFPAFGAET